MFRVMRIKMMRAESSRVCDVVPVLFERSRCGMAHLSGCSWYALVAHISLFRDFVTIHGQRWRHHIALKQALEADALRVRQGSQLIFFSQRYRRFPLAMMPCPIASPQKRTCWQPRFTFMRVGLITSITAAGLPPSHHLSQ